MALRHRWVAGVDRLFAQHATQLLGGDLLVAMHQTDERLLLARLEHDRLDHEVLVDTKRIGTRPRPALLDVGVLVNLMRGAGCTEREQRRSGGHLVLRHAEPTLERISEAAEPSAEPAVCLLGQKASRTDVPRSVTNQ